MAHELISEEYRELNRKKHQEEESWGSTAPRYAGIVAGLIKSYECDSVLDYGCGKGDLRDAMPVGVMTNLVHWDEYDPAIKHKASSSQFPMDLVACIDVMEHVEGESLSAVLADIYAIAGKVVFFVIATRPAIHLLPDGSNCHRTIMDGEQWLKKLMTWWKIRCYNRLADAEIMVVCEKHKEG